MERSLERELKVLEIAGRKANATTLSAEIAAGVLQALSSEAQAHVFGCARALVVFQACFDRASRSWRRTGKRPDRRCRGHIHRIASAVREARRVERGG